MLRIQSDIVTPVDIAIDTAVVQLAENARK